MKLRLTILLLVVVLMIPAVGSAAPQPQADPSFTLTDCPFDIPIEADTPIECGYLTVPENWDNPNGNTVQIAVAILNSRSANPQPDPIFFLEGGPGGSGTLGVDIWYTLPFLNNREMIVFDQRGTGFSIPSLDCVGIEEADDYEGELDACLNNFLNQGIDLSQYNSANSARDVNALREALGYDQINLMGISYGTRLGLTIMRDFPEIVRSATLDSVYPPNIDTNYVAMTDLYDILNDVLADCAADAACNAAFPNLQADFLALMDNFPAGTASDPETGEAVDIDALTVYGNLYNQFFNGLGASAPAAFAALLDGDYDTYLELATFGGDMGDVGGGGGAVGAELLEELTPEEIAELEGIVAQGNPDAVIDFFLSLFDGSADEFRPLAQALVNGQIAPDGTELGAGGGDMAGGMDIDPDVLADAETILGDLFSEELEEIDALAADGDIQGIADFLDELYGLSDEGLDPVEYAEAVAALSTGDFGMDDGGDMTGEAPMAGENDGDSLGMNLSVQCNEELSFLDMDTMFALAEEAGLPADFIEATSPVNEFFDCEVWPAGVADPIENEAVFSDIPTLVISGEYDPATPFSWGDLAAETLSNSTHFVFPRQGHSLMTAAGPCPGEITQAFLDTLVPDGSCFGNFNDAFFIP